MIDLQSHCCAPACTVECPGWRAPIPSLYAAPNVISHIQRPFRHPQKDCARNQVKHSIDVTKGANLLIDVKSSTQTCPEKVVLTSQLPRIAEHINCFAKLNT